MHQKGQKRVVYLLLATLLLDACPKYVSSLIMPHRSCLPNFHVVFGNCDTPSEASDRENLPYMHWNVHLPAQRGAVFSKLPSSLLVLSFAPSPICLRQYPASLRGCGEIFISIHSDSFDVAFSPMARYISGFGRALGDKLEASLAECLLN